MSTSATLIGIEPDVEQWRTLVIPVFMNYDGQRFTQRISDYGTIAGFVPVTTDGEFRDVSLRIHASVGDPAIFGFECEDGEFLLDIAPALAKRLIDNASPVGTNPATTRRVQTFAKQWSLLVN